MTCNATLVPGLPLPTYTIVSASQAPLGPSEINAGQPITVQPGDVFIIDPSADDAVTFGDRASFREIDTEDGDDTIRLGDDADGDKVKAGSGNDSVRTGSNEQISTVDGEDGNDRYATQASGTSSKHMESTAVVCFPAGTRNKTKCGTLPVERLTVGDLVWTHDHGVRALPRIAGLRCRGEATR